MKCPYCGNEMAHGQISGDRYNLKFVPDYFTELKGDELLRSGIFGDYIQLSKHKVFVNRVFCDYCSNCKKVIISVKDFHKKKEIN